MNDRPLLTVMTYNIHHGESARWEYGIDAVAEVIRSQCTPPFVVGLQEVDRFLGARSRWDDQPALLAAQTGCRGFFGGATRVGGLGEFGSLVLTTGTITTGSTIPLPRLPGLERRHLLELDIDVGGYRIRFLSVHLSREVRERDLQIKALAQRIDGVSRLFLVGDLNCEPNAPELAPLNSRLIDAWPVAGEGDGLTRPAEHPTARIDYILTSPDVSVEYAWVPVVVTSDHRPVLAAMSLDSNQP